MQDKAPLKEVVKYKTMSQFEFYKWGRRMHRLLDPLIAEVEIKGGLDNANLGNHDKRIRTVL